jgi:putative ABC transport system substrate-binding protein
VIIRRPLHRTLSYAVIILSILFQFTLASAGYAQSSTYVIGELSNIPVNPDSPLTTNGVAVDRRTYVHKGLEEKGYIEGQNVTYLLIEDSITFDPTVLEAAAKKLVEAKVDVIVTYGTASALIAQKAAAGTDIPVVFTGSVNPVELGLVKSLENTEGNVTGVGSTSDAYAKQLEWLLILDPTIKRVFVPMTSTPDALTQAAMKAVQDYAEKSGVEVFAPVLDTPEAVDALIADFPDVDALMIIGANFGDPRYVQLCIERKILMSTAFPNYMDSGVMLSYNYTEDSVGLQTSRYVDRLLRGAKPSDLPVEMATQALALNVKTAQAIGLEIPDDILQQAGIIVR